MIKKIILNALKITAIAYLVYYLVYKVSWASLPRIIEQINRPFFFAALIAYFLKFLFDAYRWLVANRLYGVSISFLDLLKYSFIAPAFAFTIPLPQGEDVYKFYILRRHTENLGACVSVPVLIRVSGLFSTVFLMPFTIWYYQNYLHVMPSYKVFVVMTVFAAIAVLGYILSVSGRIPARLKTWINTFLEQVKQFIEIIKTNNAGAIMLLITGAVSQLFYAAFLWFLMHSMKTDIGLITIILSLPLVYLGAMLPVGKGGIGLKEGVIIWLLTIQGISTMQSQAIALCHLCVFLLFIVIGCVLYFLDKPDFRVFKQEGVEGN